VNTVFKFVPMVFTATMIATEMPAAIKPYSMAVAPLSLRRKLPISLLIGGIPRVVAPERSLLLPDFDKVNRIDESPVLLAAYTRRGRTQREATGLAEQAKDVGALSAVGYFDVDRCADEIKSEPSVPKKGLARSRCN